MGSESTASTIQYLNSNRHTSNAFPEKENIKKDHPKWCVPNFDN